MATQITTSMQSNATAPSAAPLVAFAPSDNSAIVLFHTGSAPTLATAQSPYTTWSTQTIGGATARHMLALRVNGDDSLDVMVCSPSNDAFYFHYTRSGNAWSSDGNFNVISGAGDSSGTAQSGQFLTDPQSRLWWVTSDQTLATRTLYVDYTTAPTSSWTHSLNVTITGVYPGLPFAAIIGNYLVVVYQDGSGGLKYQRLDVSGVSLGSWSTAAAISGISDVATTVQGDLCAVPGGSTGVLVYASNGNGIKTYVYDALADTWTASTTLSAATSDRQPSLTPGASGVVYAIWSQLVSGSNYTIVTKAYRSGTWDASVTTLEASAAGQSWPNAAYLASSTKFGLLFTNATASPFGVEFDLVNAPTGGGTVNGIGRSDGAGSNTASATIATPAVSGGLGQATASATLFDAAVSAGAGSAQAVATLLLTAISAGRAGDVEQLGVGVQPAGAVSGGRAGDVAVLPSNIQPGTATVSDTLGASATVSDALAGTAVVSDA